MNEHLPIQVCFRKVEYIARAASLVIDCVKPKQNLSFLGWIVFDLQVVIDSNESGFPVMQ